MQCRPDAQLRLIGTEQVVQDDEERECGDDVERIENEEGRKRDLPELRNRDRLSRGSGNLDDARADGSNTDGFEVRAIQGRLE